MLATQQKADKWVSQQILLKVVLCNDKPIGYSKCIVLIL